MSELDLPIRIAAIGGGHGLATVAEALASEYPNADVTALSTVVDSGSASGEVRTLLGQLSGGEYAYGLGDLRNVLGRVSTNLGGGMFAERFGDDTTVETLAAKNSDMLAMLHAQGMDDIATHEIMADTIYMGSLLGSLKGHTYGTLVLGALCRRVGLVKGLEVANDWLQTRNVHVQTLTETPHHLHMHDNGRVLVSEGVIDDHRVEDPAGAQIWLTPDAHITPEAEQAIAEADIVIAGPGSFWTSTLPCFAIRGVSEAIQAQARRADTSRIIVANLVQEPNAGTMSMHAQVRRIEQAAGVRFKVVHNTDIESVPPTYTALCDNEGILGDRGFGAKLVSAVCPEVDPNDPLAGTAKRSQAPLHDGPALAAAIMAAHMTRQPQSLAVV
ncbi:MAG TPA: 2-phospho-L-lactate transferase CofD family protein [Candidatus Saccharimonadales bacterium]